MGIVGLTGQTRWVGLPIILKEMVICKLAWWAAVYLDELSILVVHSNTIMYALQRLEQNILR